MAIRSLARRRAPVAPLVTTVPEHWDRRRCHARPYSRLIVRRTNKAGYRDQNHLWSRRRIEKFADRTSTATMMANQLRLWLSSFAYALVCAVRRIGLMHTQFADATAGTIRLKLFRIGALVKVSARRIKFALPTACPYADEWRLAALYLARAAPV